MPGFGRSVRVRAGRRPAAVAPPPLAPSIRISPNDPGVIQGAPPQAYIFQVAVANLPTVKWAVFQVSTSGQYTSDMLWQEVAVPGSSATLSITAQLKGERDVFVVKSLDDAVEDSTVGARFAGVPAGTGTALQRVQAFVAPLRMGVNIERGKAIWDGWITDSLLRQYASQGITHVRFFPPHQVWRGLYSQNDMQVWYDACQRSINAGHTAFLDLLDITGEADLNRSEVRPFVEQCAQSIASRNFDPRKFAVGVAQEYEGGSNTGFQARREELLDVLHGALPNHIIVTASANWGNPWTLLDGTMYVDASKPRLHQWHLYAENAGELWRTQDLQANLSAWAASNNTVTICGEYSKAPPSGGYDLVGPPAYGEFPGIITAAAEGMGQQRPMIWTTTDGSWWRLNVDTSAALRSEVATAFQNGSEHIRTRQWYIDQNATQQPAPPTGSQVARIQILHRGQSNAYFADQYGAPNMLRDTMASLTGLPIDMVSRKEVADATIHSGTYSFWDSPYNGDDRWLDAGGNYGSAPSGWANRDPMAATLAAVNAHVSGDQNIPLIIFELHHEYDLAMEDAASKAAYRDGHFEITRRIRAARPKAALKSPLAIGYCPYEGGQLHALFDIVSAWNADIATQATRDVQMACGNMMDGQRNTQYDPAGDPSHWGDQSAPRIYPRVAFRFAKMAYDSGWCPPSVNLGDCPGMGPRIVSATRSGNSINLTVEHDKGTSLMAGANGIDWRCFTASDGAGNNHFDASGGAVTGATTIRVDFPRQPVDGGRIWHCVWPNFRFRTIVRDNWHDIRPAKYSGVPNIGVVEFPLQRTLAGIPYTAAAPVASNPPTTLESAGPTPGTPGP